MDPLTFYIAREKDFSASLTKLKQKRTAFGFIRFGNIILIIALFYFSATLGWYAVIGLTILLLILFRWLILKDLANKASIVHTTKLLAAVQNEHDALAGKISQFATGMDFYVQDHSYANDLDIIGSRSIYQFCNRTHSWNGRSKLATWLLYPATSEIITARQEAIRELAQARNFGLELQATGDETPVSQSTYNKLTEWLAQPDQFSGFKQWKWLRFLLPAIAVSITTAAILELVPMNVMYITLLLFAVIAYQINKVVAPVHEKLSKIVEEVDALSKSIRVIEQESFDAPLLRELKDGLIKDPSSSSRIRQLKRTLDRLDIRYNIVLSAPLNLLLLWNLQQVLDLEKWKKENTKEVEKWFNVLAAFEVLNSFAGVSFNNPGWCFPEIKDKFEINGINVGHPLIKKEKRVFNDVSFGQTDEIMIVTGSNMAGKSTYLRSIGVNIVLAMAGAAVCASSFKISSINLHSSMRVSDDLRDDTSTFYAELKKIKQILDATNETSQVFILLDEMLRGTNSIDRYKGSVALIKQLIRNNAPAVVATHDVALADLQQSYPGQIGNYHFESSIENDELRFDYKLKPGVSTSINASLLMKKMGIEI